MFCGDLVCTKEEQEVLGRGSRKSEQLLRKLLGPNAEKQEASLTKAEKHKNTLLEYDATCEKRTQVCLTLLLLLCWVIEIWPIR